MTEEKLSGASLFGRSAELMGNDPFDEIFELNLGDFISENLISKELVEKISKKDKDKNSRLKKQLRELTEIYSSDNTLKILGFNSKDDYVIYHSIAQTVKDMLECDAVHIYLAAKYAKGLDSKGNDLVLTGSTVDLKKNFTTGYKLSDKYITIDAFNSVEIKTANKNIDKLMPLNKDLKEDKVKNVTVFPMHNNAKVVGIIVAENYKDVKIKDEYVKTIKSIGSLFGTSMWLQEITEEVERAIKDENTQTAELKQLRTELTALIGDLGDQQQAFVENLAYAVDVKGQYKVAHSKNTADLSRKICKEMGLNEKTTDLIDYAGLLQNIGKITLPENIFTNKGKISQEEWKKIKQTPNIGVSLLMHVNFLSEVIPYIKYHKELWNGTGEPEGLKGWSIPLGSRIIAVADAYSALTSDRSYRNAMPKEKALEIMDKETNEKWDKDVISALKNIV